MALCGVSVGFARRGGLDMRSLRHLRRGLRLCMGVLGVCDCVGEPSYTILGAVSSTGNGF